MQDDLIKTMLKALEDMTYCFMDINGSYGSYENDTLDSANNAILLAKTYLKQDIKND